MSKEKGTPCIKSYGSTTKWHEFLYEVQNRWDYKGKDENQEPIYEHTKPYPIIDLKGTLKLGGTNTSMLRKNGEIFFQSKTTLLESNEDYGNFKKSNLDSAEELFKLVDEVLGTTKEDDLVIYGEWCGEGIKDKASISRVKGKRWVIFSIQYLEHEETTFPNEYNNVDIKLHDKNIFNILEFGVYNYSFNLNDHKVDCTQPHLIPRVPFKEFQDYIDSKSLECIVSKFFDVTRSVEDYNGEGMVFTYFILDKLFRFKVKNSKYEKAASVIKDLKPKIVYDDSLLELCNTILASDARLEQFINKFITEERFEMRNIKLYLDEVKADIIKEENSLLTDDKWIKVVDTIARDYFILNFKHK